MNYLLFLSLLSNPGIITFLIVFGTIGLFIVRAIIKHYNEEDQDQKDIDNITDWKKWDEWNEMPAAKNYPDLMEKAKKIIINKEMAMIDMMKLPEKISLCERAITFPALQYEIKKKIKEFIEGEYESLAERVIQSWEAAEYLKRLGQNALKVGGTELAIKISKLEERYRPPSHTVVEVHEKENAVAV